MEGIALNLRCAIDALRGLATLSDEMLAVGGGSQSPLWQQIYADVLNVKVVRTNVGQEAGSLGAAAVAAVGAGLWDDFSTIDKVHEVVDVAEPIAENVDRYEEILGVFKQSAQSQAQLGDALAALRA
jgi:xylulokinase